MTHTSRAFVDVIAERQRQIEVEGWTPEHDDAHKPGDLAVAAACYALHAGGFPASVVSYWPWDRKWWKPKRDAEGSRRDLVRAAALVVAEIERLDRSNASRAGAL